MATANLRVPQYSALYPPVFGGRSRLEPSSRPLFGLPLRRVLPMPLHALADYAASFLQLASGMLADSEEGRVAGVTLAAMGAGVTAVSDHDLSLAKAIPVEGHEAFDYFWGAAAIAAPFFLGYGRRDPLTAAVHVLTGLATLASALFTDYRSARAAGAGRAPGAAGPGDRS